MISKNTQNEFLHELYITTGVNEAYFHKNILWVEPQDEGYVQRFLDESEWGDYIRYRLTTSELV